MSGQDAASPAGPSEAVISAPRGEDAQVGGVTSAGGTGVFGQVPPDGHGVSPLDRTPIVGPLMCPPSVGPAL